MRFSSLFLMLALVPAGVSGGGLFSEAQIVFLGEQHDNPHHHKRQAAIVEELRPTAVVFEMLTSQQAEGITPDLTRDEDALETTLGWNDSGWPDFSMYYPIFAAADQAKVFGAAVPRETVQNVDATNLAATFGDGAALFGLDQALPTNEQTKRNTLQAEAHCNALPESLLPRMVSIQRLRDAVIAREALRALEIHGAPVVVITGNGHARTDWGAPALIARAAPDITVASLGQAENGGMAPPGTFDTIETTDAPKREDPCAAFR